MSFAGVHIWNTKYEIGDFFHLSRANEDIPLEEWLEIAERHLAGYGLGQEFEIQSLKAYIRIKTDIILRDYCS